ncbi:MAG: pyridoxamine 5'-phosphate oxidase family protein, partial [Pseudomonadota bacterium]
MTIITTDAELDEIYGAPVQRSVTKELDHISEHYRAYIEAAPFAVIASAGEAGLDCTPRGDPAGFVAVI